MLLIPCPYCGAAPGDRVPLRRRGAYRPPARSGRSSTTRTGRTTSSTAPTRRACTSSAGATSMAAGAGSTRCATRSATAFIATYRDGRGAARRSRSERRDERRPTVSPSGGRIDRARPLALHLRRPQLRGLCRRHARLGAARQRRPPGRRGRSSITGRAASCPPAPRSRTRCVQLDRGGGRSRPEPARHRGRALRRPDARQPEPLAVARLRPRRGQRPALAAVRRPASTTRPSCGRAPSGSTVYEPVIRARRRPRHGADARPIPTATCTATPIATCWSSAPARRAWPRRSPPAEPARA